MILGARCPTQTHTFPQGQGKALGTSGDCGGSKALPDQAGVQAEVPPSGHSPRKWDLANGVLLGCGCASTCGIASPRLFLDIFVMKTRHFVQKNHHLPCVWAWCLRREGGRRHHCQKWLRNGWGWRKGFKVCVLRKGAVFSGLAFDLLTSGKCYNLKDCPFILKDNLF